MSWNHGNLKLEFKSENSINIFGSLFIIFLKIKNVLAIGNWDKILIHYRSSSFGEIRQWPPFAIRFRFLLYPNPQKSVDSDLSTRSFATQRRIPVLRSRFGAAELKPPAQRRPPPSEMLGDLTRSRWASIIFAVSSSWTRGSGTVLSLWVWISFAYANLFCFRKADSLILSMGSKKILRKEVVVLDLFEITWFQLKNQWAFIFGYFPFYAFLFPATYGCGIYYLVICLRLKFDLLVQQFDARGNLLHQISTKIAASSYGEDELISLIQT